MCAGELGGHINCAAILLWHIGMPLGVLCLCAMYGRAIVLWPNGRNNWAEQLGMGCHWVCFVWRTIRAGELDAGLFALFGCVIWRGNWMLT